MIHANLDQSRSPQRAMFETRSEQGLWLTDIASHLNGSVEDSLNRAVLEKLEARLHAAQSTSAGSVLVLFTSDNQNSSVYSPLKKFHAAVIDGSGGVFRLDTEKREQVMRWGTEIVESQKIQLCSKAQVELQVHDQSEVWFEHPFSIMHRTSLSTHEKPSWRAATEWQMFVGSEEIEAFKAELKNTLAERLVDAVLSRVTTANELPNDPLNTNFAA